MQSLAWSTVAILVLLLPGFFFFTGMYLPENFARDVTPKNPLGTLAAVVLVAFLTHGGLTFALARAAPDALEVDWEAVITAVQLPPEAPGDAETSVQRTAAAFESHTSLIVGYVGISCLLGGLSGLAVGLLVVSGRLRWVVKHSWTYGLRPRSRNRLSYVDVLTNVENDGMVLQYRGRVVYFNLTAEGTFAYVVLAVSEQWFLRVDGHTVRFPAPERRALAQPLLADGAGVPDTPGTQAQLRVWLGEMRMWGRRWYDRLLDDVGSVYVGRAGIDPQSLWVTDVDVAVRRERPPQAGARSAEGGAAVVLNGARRGRDAAARWLRARRQGSPSDPARSILVVHGAHLKSLRTDVFYDLENPEDAEAPTSAATAILDHATMSPEEKIQAWMALRPLAAPRRVPPAERRRPTATSPQEAIAQAQRLLAELGYEAGAADGREGPNTRAAVRRFQTDAGIPADGDIGPLTLSALVDAREQQEAGLAGG